MNAKSKKQAKGREDSVARPAALAGRNRDFPQNLAEASNNYVKGLVNIQGEWLNFANSRLQSNMEISRDIFSCKDLTEVMQVQRVWFEKANEEYQTGFARLWDLASEMTEAS